MEYYADASHPDSAVYNAAGAAWGVAGAIVLGVFILYALKKSGFRAMVAVGR